MNNNNNALVITYIDGDVPMGYTIDTGQLTIR